MRIDTMYASYEGIMLQVSKYVADNSIAIQAWNMEEGPIATLTVCLDDKSLGENEAYLDTNNCPWVVGFMDKYGLGELTGKVRPSGYCLYPAAKINMDEVMKFVFKEEEEAEDACMSTH